MTDKENILTSLIRTNGEYCNHSGICIDCYHTLFDHCHPAIDRGDDLFMSNRYKIAIELYIESYSREELMEALL